MAPRTAFGSLPQMLWLKVRSISAKNLGAREVELVNSAMHRVVLDRGQYVEPGLLKTQRQPACACKEVYRDGPAVVRLPRPIPNHAGRLGTESDEWKDHGIEGIRRQPWMIQLLGCLV